MRRLCHLALLAMLSILPAVATTVVVPTDFSTIQDAVDAVQGTPDGRVVIMSNATFDETVLISESLVLEAARGYEPIIAGTGACSGLGGNCTLDVSPTAAAPQSFTIRGLRLLPPPSPTYIVKIENLGSAEATVLLDEVTLESSGPDAVEGLAIRSGGGSPGAGANHVIVQQSSILLGGSPGTTTTGVSMAEKGTLLLDSVVLQIIGASGEGVDVRGTLGTIDLTLVDSRVTVAAPPGFYSSEIAYLSGSVSASIARNRFLLVPDPQGQIDGITMSTGNASSQNASLELNGNRFSNQGSTPVGYGVSLAAFESETLTVAATNNVMHGLETGLRLVGYSPVGDPTAGGAIQATLTNNTIAGSTGDAVTMEAQSGAAVTASLFNSLITHGAGRGVFAFGSGALSVWNDANGFYSNMAGNYDGLPSGINDVVGDPLYFNLAAGDLRLHEGSAMIDGGNDTAPGLPITDILGQPRILGGRVDCGAFENDWLFADGFESGDGSFWSLAVY